MTFLWVIVSLLVGVTVYMGSYIYILLKDQEDLEKRLWQHRNMINELWKRTEEKEHEQPND